MYALKMKVAQPIVALIVIVIFVIVILIFIPNPPQKYRATTDVHDVVEMGEVVYFDPKETAQIIDSGIPRHGDFYSRPLFHSKKGTRNLSDHPNMDQQAGFMGATTLASHEAIAIWGHLSSTRTSKYLGITGYVYDLNVSRSSSRRPSVLTQDGNPIPSGSPVFEPLGGPCPSHLGKGLCSEAHRSLSLGGEGISSAILNEGEEQPFDPNSSNIRNQQFSVDDPSFTKDLRGVPPQRVVLESTDDRSWDPSHRDIPSRSEGVSLRERKSSREAGAPEEQQSRKVVLASVADPVSISEVHGPVCVIMTSNSNLIAPLRRKLLSTPGFPPNSIFKIIPIYSSLHKETHRYTMLLHLVSNEDRVIRSSIKMSRSNTNISELTEIHEDPTSQTVSTKDLPKFRTLRYENIAVSHEGFNDVMLKHRGNDVPESNLSSSPNPNQVLLDDATKILINHGYQIINHLDVIPFLSADLGPRGLDNGFQCISQNLNCEGENRDRTVFQTKPFRIAKGNKIAVLAIDHASSGKAIYSTVTFSTLVKTDPSMITQADQVGSCFNPFRGTTYETSETLTQHLTQITGDAQSMETVPSLVSKLIVYQPNVDTESYVVVTEKIYIEPLSKIGPAVQELMPINVFVITNGESQ
jgi:hypothetical protein